MPTDSSRVAIVTGAARGIGAATAKRLASDGMAVGVLDLDAGACEPTVDAITAAGGRAVAVGADVSDAEQVATAVGKVAAELGPPVVLVNNAGIIRDNLLFKMSEDDWDMVLGVHLRGAFLMSRAAQKHMVEQRFGRIVNLSSSSALGNRGQVNYSAAKAGMQGFTKTLAIELGQFGDHRQRRGARVHRHRHDRRHRGPGRHGIRGLPGRRGQPDPGAPGRPARRHCAPDLVPGQRGRRVRVRPGDLRGGRPAVLTEGRPGQRGAAPSRYASSWPGTTRPRCPGWSSCAPGSTPGWPGCTTRPGSAARACPGRSRPRWTPSSRRRVPRTTTRPGSASAWAWRLPRSLRIGSEEQQQRWLRPLWTGEEVWCQLFSEPGAGSDLAGLATRAARVTGDGQAGAGWQVTGQKVWTSIAHVARWGLLLARTDPDVPKHAGLTYFGLDMNQPGVEVRPLRQLTGEAEFNEVFLTDAVVPDADRIGGIGEGWRVAQATLMNERIAIGGGALPREGGMVRLAVAAWREHPEARTPGLHDRLIRLWADAEVARLAGARLRQQLAAGTPGPEGSAAKVVFARLNQELCAFELELAGAAG